MESQRLILRITLVVVSLCAGLWAAPTTPYEAEMTVVGWLGLDPAPLGTALGQEVSRVEPFTDAGGRVVYYVVSLEPTGFVVVAADDLVEPIIAFAAEGQYEPSQESPVGALVTRDLSRRMLSVRTKDKGLKTPATTAGNPNPGKWRRLKEAAAGTGKGMSVKSRSGISGVRVAPFTKTKWGQGSVCGEPCYNYYTPNEYPAGCVATAMAQLMYYHKYPQDDYAWNQMVLAPNCGTTDAQRQAIGRLCSDAGVAADTEYGESGSSSNMYYAAVALRGAFDYDNAIFAYKYDEEIENEVNIGSGLTNMVNPNLDAGYPVILGIIGEGGHAVVADGYGYDGSTPYHHLNVGPEDQHSACNIWYNLNIPNIDIPGGHTYGTITECTYNVFTNQDGEIVSGRVTNSAGHPIVGARVETVVEDEYWDLTLGPVIFERLVVDTTDAKGIYALVGVPSGDTCTVNVAKEGYDFAARMVSVGTSMDAGSVSGNKWGINFQGTRTGTGGPIEVLWDLHHGVCGDAWLPSDGYGNLVELLEPKGYNTSTTYSGVQSVDLSAYDVLVVSVGTAWESNYDSSEVATIRTFVEGGGGLLIMGDHPRCHNYVRPIAMDYGFIPAVEESWEGDIYVTDFSSHVIFENCSELYFRVAGHIGFTPGRCTMEAWDEDRYGMVGTASAGAGRVVITGDCDFCRYPYLGDSDNKTFIGNVFDWLAGIL